MLKRFLILIECCFVVLCHAAHPSYDSTIDSLRMTMPEFDCRHGFYQEAFDVSINAQPQGAIVMYTTDGSEPSENNGTRYTKPIRVEKTTVLRACVLKSGECEYDSRIATVTYLFLEDIINQGESIEGYPDKWGPYSQISGTAKADYGMDPELTATPAQRDSIIKGFLSLPAVSIVTDKDYIFNHENDSERGGIYIYTDPPTGYPKAQVKDPGTKWLRPTSVEFFDAAGELSIQADCGLRLHGGHSRLAEKSPKHGFRLVFKEKYGKKKLKANIFGETQAKKLDNIVLRGGFCNTWIHANHVERGKALYTRDSWAKEVQAAMGHPHSHQRFAHLFINGIYWGMYNITERIDEGWCEEYLGGYDTDYDVIKVEDNPQSVVANSGTMANWETLFAFSEASASESNYQEIERLLDIENFIDYMIINIYGGNTDWDRHNWLAVYNAIEPNEGFKMLCWDSEHVLKDLNQDVGLGEMRELCPSTLMQNLLKYPEFCRLVGDRIQRQCYQDGPLEPENTRKIWLRLSEEISSALHCEAARWGDYRRDVHSWKSSPYELYTKETHYNPLQKDMLENILPYRRDVFVNQMKARGLFPEIQAPVIYLNEEVYKGQAIFQSDIISLDCESGDIYYSLDGKDPVEWDAEGNGQVSATAKKYMRQEFMLEVDTFCLMARVQKNGKWSALSQITLSPSQVQTSLKSPQTAHLFETEATLVADGVIRLNAYRNRLHIRLFSCSGACLRQWQTEGQERHTLDISNLPSGIYLLQAQSGQEQKHVKIILP